MKVVRTVSDMAGVLDQVLEVSFDASGTDEELFAATEVVVRVRNRMDGLLVDVAAALDRAGVARRHGRRLTELLVAAGVTPGCAARVARASHRVAGLPRVRTDLAEGRISAEMADVVGAGMTLIERRCSGLDDAGRDRRERELMRHVISGATPAQVRDTATGIANELAAQAGEDTGAGADAGKGVEPRHDRAANDVSITPTEDGRYALRGDVDAVIGSVVAATLTTLASARSDKESGEPDTRSKGQRMADALHLLAATTGEGLRKALISVVINTDKPHTPRIPSLGVIDPIVTELLACDAVTEPVVVSGAGIPVAMGRTVRTFTPAQKRALEIRDRGCIKCGAPPALTDAHHIDWWGRDEGRTDVDNGCLLCRTCHAVVHQQQWQIVIGHDHHPWLTPPAAVDPTRTPVKSYYRRTLTLAA